MSSGARRVPHFVHSNISGSRPSEVINLTLYVRRIKSLLCVDSRVFRKSSVRIKRS